MECSTTRAITTSTTLKKLKREVAHRRRLHARSLRLRAEEQERLQRLEIDALVDQQRSQRLADQREIRQDTIINNATSTQEEDACKGAAPSATKPEGEEDDDQSNDMINISRRGIPGHVVHDHNEQQVSTSTKRDKRGAAAGLLRPDHNMTGAADSRRRLARGPRSGSCNAGADTVKGHQMINVQNMMAEDHRVLSTEYQAAGTQAVMKVTILAAGFVIGARGISARHIGQVTGAIVHSWTEGGGGGTSDGSGAGRVIKKSGSNQAGMPAPAVRLFRIQGKKAVVQAAVTLIQEAVARYKELCECKRRGEFVQREHRIGGVEFYYQPPPRKALNTNAVAATGNKSLPVPPPPLPPAHAWLPPRPPPPPPPSLDRVLDWSIAQVPPPPPLPTSLLPCRPRASVASIGYAMQHVRLAAEGQSSEAAPRAPDPPVPCTRGSGGSLFLRCAGLKLPAPPVTSNNNNSNSNCSLFSIFGNGGLPMPIAQPLFSAQRPTPPPPQPLTTPFDFSSYDFLRDSNLPAIVAAAAPPLPPSRAQLTADCCFFGNENSCALCSQPPAAGVRLMTCGHGAFCFSCIRGTAVCPLCREKILGFQTSGNVNASFKGWPALGKAPQKTAGP